ncbi:P-loop containing nucleoside triphosphate hydrolase protein [Sparassis crispa]|uniref:P-loop containing nucleoside triphosphate hydrolase protein n=1 Tax=Sparassis crispa TaxID=139825 RepID=A0A401GQF5_9APHY|nr:P-loop containing nucleoside triphosphate hydrolase protein [Sparassis crispa]GBE84471.1 P-loop containing nucleoside triphosphate hydrolase protein [Sparassis crispa]
MPKKAQRPKKQPSRVSNIRLDSPPLIGPPPTKRQKVKPLSSLAKPPVFGLTGSQPGLSSQSDPKKKGKERETPRLSEHEKLDDLMWVDKYEPTTEADLAVHKRKVQEIRQWLLDAFDGGPSGKLKKYRRILALTGPAGTAKTTTIRVLSRELGFEILEWRNTMDERFSRDDDFAEDMEYEGLSDKFRTFLERASSCNSIFPSTTTKPSSSRPSQAATGPRRQIILLEDLPNIAHASTQAAFHAALEAFAGVPEPGVAPLVLIVSDAGLRGEDGEDVGGAWRARGREALDIRSVLPPALLNSSCVTQIGFNPIAPTLLKRALQHLLDTHFAAAAVGAPPAKNLLNAVVESANGDIRSAIMALQFACVAEAAAPGRGGKRSRKAGGPSARVLLEAVTRREQSLALFHLLGKLLYNKRKGDPPNASAAARDIQRDKEIDARLKDPPSLPSHLKEHERRASRVDIEMLYADTPIDASLLSLYVHQNYTQYCNELDQCDAEADWLSWLDASGGEAWYQANPHHFHLLALGTLHALPSPVARRGQKAYKPAFFEVLHRERAAEDSVRDVQAWLRRHEEWRAGGWSRLNVALELGGVLGAREHAGGAAPPPGSHRLFSKMEFAREAGPLVQVDEEGDVPQDMLGDENIGFTEGAGEGEAHGGGWLEGDDIEEF